MLFLFSITWGAVSGWWTPVCLLLGLLYAWLMYREPVDLSKSSRYVLAALRAIAVFTIAFLLISPLVQSVTYQPQKPLVLVAQDNSSSIQTFKPNGFDAQQFVKTLSALKQQLGNDYEVRDFHFSSSLTNGLTDNFNGRQTNIATVIRQLNDQYVNQNIGALVLATDGLYNQGADPQYEARNLKTSIYAVALGDTTPRRDLLIGNINYNKIAFLGDDFVIEVLAEAYQSQGEAMQINVAEDGRTVSSQKVAVNSNAYRKIIPIKINADKKGIHRFSINIKPVSNELSVQNNTETIYIEVLDTRQKILVAYQSPHPDISVIKQAIERNKNYEVKAIQAANLGTIKLSDYGLVVLYQLPVAGNALLNDYVTKSKIPVWYMAGAQTDLGSFNTEQKTVQIASARPDMQEVFALPVNNFSAFTLSDSAQNKIAHLPPLLAPFGNYGTATGAALLFKQRIGNVNTDYPLLAFNDADGRRTAVLAGEGLWRWQLAEYQTYGNHNAVEELFSQSIQYLTANANRQRFRAYPARNVFDEGENVLLNAELYNDALELINTPDVSINLKNTAGKNYSFLFSREGNSYQLNANSLPSGEYSYMASTKIGKQNFTAQGQFSVRALNLESRQSTANHQLLLTLAKQSGGQMLLPSQINRLADIIRRNENIKTVVYDDKHYSDLIDVKWVFVVIIALLSTEWFLRKRAGEI